MASIRERNGRFQVRWREHGRAVAETFPTRVQARQFQGLVMAAGERYPEGWIPGTGFPAGGGPTAAGQGRGSATSSFVGSAPTLSLAEWFERAVAARTTANDRSKQDMRRDFHRHVPAWLADTPVDRITREQAGLWVNQLRTQPRGGTGEHAGQPVSTKTIHNVHGHVSGAMNDAVRDGLAQRNPFSGLLRGMPRTPAQEMVCLTPEEFVLLRRQFIEHYHPFLTFLYATGLRFGEITALGPEHFDLVHRTVRVDRAWKYDPVRHTYLGPPKTARAARTVTFNDGVAEMVTPLLDAARSRPRTLGDPALVFVNTRGSRIQNGAFHAHQWNPAITKAMDEGLTQRPRLHDLRHSHASLMLAEGNSMYAVSRRLGHASITTTDARYSHLLPEMDEQMRSSLDRIPILTSTPTRLRLIRDDEAI
ncbi:site-specific integrase [Pedococcus bigeumensis]|uniref:tyrosine-type recombinase/integrase n=1 Tax=Pedococcus bigeumensis TaxID=433644 RepID=UPI002FE70513